MGASDGGCKKGLKFVLPFHCTSPSRVLWNHILCHRMTRGSLDVTLPIAQCKLAAEYSTTKDAVYLCTLTLFANLY